MTQVREQAHGSRPAGKMAWLRLLRVHQRMERAAMEHLREWGLTVPQFDVLAHVAAHPGVTQQELAESRLTTKGNLSQILSNMEACGLTTRLRDGHSKRIYLADRGRELVEQVQPDHERVMAAHFEPLTEPELDELRRLLRRLDRPREKQR